MRSLILLLALTAIAAADRDQAAELVGRVQEIDELTRLIQREYALPVSRDEIWGGALRGMVDGLDGGCRYLAPAEVAQYGSMQAGRGFGYGFDWQPGALGEIVEIIRIIPDSPAYVAGLAPGDRITAIDGRPIARIGIGAARRLLLRSGGEIGLEILHPDRSSSDMTLTRGDFNDSGVLPERLVGEGIGLLRIARFRDGRDAESSPTVQAFRAAIGRLREQGMQGLILDLRGNGGGSLIAAVAIADAFINAGHQEPRLIVEQVSRNPARNHRFTARSTTTLPDWPLVVLIDRHTASSAEIVAAALKDHRRATLVGERSFGKNSIQELFVLDSGAALLLTVAHFRSPAQRREAVAGVEPQVRIAHDALRDWRLARRRQLLAREQPLPEDLVDLRDPAIDRAVDMLTAAIVHSSR